MSPIPTAAPPAREAIAAREFARRDGCDPKAVRRAKEDGRLQCDARGRPFVDQVGGPWREGNRRAGDSSGDMGGDTPSASPASSAVSPASQPLAIPDAEAFVEAVLAGRYHPRAAAEAVKENALALRQVLEVQKLSGALVSRAAVVDACFKAARAERDTMLAWPGRVAPLIAADLGVDPGKVAGLLAEHMHELLSDLGGPEIDLDDAA